MQVASVVSAPYHGYTIETKIPLADLPAAVDPQHLGLNILVYDSDTQDLTGQTRLAWSPYGGVQGDPYRWGHASLPGYTPPAGRPTTPSEPVIPDTAALSVDSPQSILQAATDGVPLGVDAGLARPGSVAWADRATLRRECRAGPAAGAATAATAHVVVRDADGVAGCGRHRASPPTRIRAMATVRGAARPACSTGSRRGARRLGRRSRGHLLVAGCPCAQPDDEERTRRRARPPGGAFSTLDEPSRQRNLATSRRVSGGP